MEGREGVPVLPCHVLLNRLFVLDGSDVKLGIDAAPIPDDKKMGCMVTNVMFTLDDKKVLQLHWSKSESERDVAWNGYLDSPVVCLHWNESDFAWKLGCNPFWSDVTSDVSLLLQYNCTLRREKGLSGVVLPLGGRGGGYPIL